MDSFAFDGQRILAWNGTSKPYGVSCTRGDVLGIFLDIRPEAPENGTISFAVNGTNYGVAFTGVRKRMLSTPSACLTPALSSDWLWHGRINFGATPFKYPPPEPYSPIEVTDSLSHYVASYWEQGSAERNLLVWAAEEGHVDAIDDFLKRSHPSSEELKRALLIALMNNHVETARRLVQASGAIPSA